jgi:hypothetical protein
MKRFILFFIIVLFLAADAFGAADYFKDADYWELPWWYDEQIVKLIEKDPKAFAEFVKLNKPKIDSTSIIYVSAIMKIKEMEEWIKQLPNDDNDTRLLKNMYFYRITNSREYYWKLFKLLKKSDCGDNYPMVIVTTLSYDDRIFEIFEREASHSDGVKSETIDGAMSWLLYMLNTDSNLYNNYVRLLQKSPYRDEFISDTHYWLTEKDVFSALEKNMRLKITAALLRNWVYIKEVSPSGKGGDACFILGCLGDTYVDSDTVVKNGNTVTFWIFRNHIRKPFKSSLHRYEAKLKRPRKIRTLEFYYYDFNNQEIERHPTPEEWVKVETRDRDDILIDAALKYAREGQASEQKPALP